MSPVLTTGHESVRPETDASFDDAHAGLDASGEASRDVTRTADGHPGRSGDPSCHVDAADSWPDGLEEDSDFAVDADECADFDVEGALCEEASSVSGAGVRAPSGPSRSSRSLGELGEDAAACYLQRRGFEIIDRNWRCRFGEADIVAYDDDELVFCEVKTRSGIEYGLPEDAVTPAKRSRYEKIAASYLSEHRLADCTVRFDVIAILVTDGRHGFLRHHQNAFARGD